MSQLKDLLDNTATILDNMGDFVDRRATAKLASEQNDAVDKIKPILDQYEQVTGTTLPEEKRAEMLLMDPDDPTFELLQNLSTKVASTQEAAPSMGGAERRTAQPNQTASTRSLSHSSTHSRRRPAPTGNRRPRREFHEL